MHFFSLPCCLFLEVHAFIRCAAFFKDFLLLESVYCLLSSCQIKRSQPLASTHTTIKKILKYLKYLYTLLVIKQIGNDDIVDIKITRQRLVKKVHSQQHPLYSSLLYNPQSLMVYTSSMLLTGEMLTVSQ